MAIPGEGLADTLLKSALDLASRGFKVFPLEPGTKIPAVKGWQEKATGDEAVIRRVWGQKDYNIGVKTGPGLVVIDIDVKKGKPGVESWKALGVKAETFRVRTASGGWHVYFEGADSGNTAGRLGPGIDTRGEGGYVVGPGSVLTNGSGRGSYEIDHDAALAALPGEIAGRLGGRREPARDAHSPLVELDRDDAIERARDYLANSAPAALEGSGGDDTTYRVAARVKDFGVSKGQAVLLMDEHWNERCSPPWDFEALTEKIENAYAYGENSPGSDHPAAVFSGVSVDPPDPVQAAPSKWFRHGDTWSRSASWLYYEAVPAVGVGVIVGPPGAGKTFLEIELARSLATGKPFFDLAPDERGGVIFLFAGTEGMGLPKRLEALSEDRALPISAAPISDLSERGALGKVLEMCREEAARMLTTFGIPLRLVVLETLSASGLLINENDNSEIGRAMANLGTLSRELNCLVVTSHHPPKGGDGERGGSAIRGSADCILSIRREGNESIRRLEITKARDSEERPLGSFTLLKTDLGKDDRGRPITSMTVSMGEAIAPSARRSQYADTLATAIDFAIMEAPQEVQGHKAAEWDATFAIFSDLKPGSKNKSNVLAAFRRVVQYAEDIGSVGSGVYAGARYLWMKEIVDE